MPAAGSSAVPDCARWGTPEPGQRIPHVDILADYTARAERATGPAALQPVDPRDGRHQLLNRLFESRCLLSLRFAYDRAVYQTAIIELAPAAGYCVLDALVPQEGNALASALSAIHLQARLGGLDLKFASRITARGSHDGLPYYQAVYPSVIEQPQRRREYRVNIPFDRGIAMHFRGAGGVSLRGELRDLSASGFCARLLSGDARQLEAPAARRGDCDIELPGGAITVTIGVCHVMPSRGRSAPRIGACFIDLDPRTERHLERCVATLERERAKGR